MLFGVQKEELLVVIAVLQVEVVEDVVHQIPVHVVLVAGVILQGNVKLIMIGADHQV